MNLQSAEGAENYGYLLKEIVLKKQTRDDDQGD